MLCTQRNFLTGNCHKFEVRAANYSHIVIIIGKLCKNRLKFLDYKQESNNCITEYITTQYYVSHILLRMS